MLLVGKSLMHQRVKKILNFQYKVYLDGETGVDLLEAALARILEAEFDLLPS